MNNKQRITLAILTYIAHLMCRHILNFDFGLFDNAPMLWLMLEGLDPEGFLGDKLAMLNISLHYIVCGLSMAINTITDGIAACVDPNSSLIGIALGCLVPILFLVPVYLMRTKTITYKLFGVVKTIPTAEINNK